MKKISLFFSAIMSLILVSCSVTGLDGRDGFDGRDGLDGLDGQDGINILGKVVDIEGDFTLDNDYRFFYEFSENNIEVFDTDVVLVYILWDQVDGSDGNPIDIWRLVPQTRLLAQGILQYNYEHTFVDVDVFLEADFDLGTLLPADTDNQVFRIAVLPADGTGKSSVDRSDMKAVMASLGVTEKDVPKVKMN